jgi:hypothetical protein
MNLHVIEKTCNDDLNINKVEVDEKSILKLKIVELTNKVTELEERLKKYTNGSNHKRYYEKNKEKIMETGSNYLKKLKEENPEKLIGNSTNQSIHSGIINGVTMEIEGFINSNLDENDNFIIILTGGDSDFLAERLKNTIFANPNFLLESLNQTFQYNHND